MQIGEVARRSGVSARSLRYYEQHGLITPARLANGYRDFDEAAVERARVLRLLFDLDVPRDLAASILACSGGAPAVVHRETRDRLATFRESVDRRIAQLQQTRDALSAALEEPSFGAPPHASA